MLFRSAKPTGRCMWQAGRGAKLCDTADEFTKRGTKRQCASAAPNSRLRMPTKMGLSMSFSIEQETVCRGPFGLYKNSNSTETGQIDMNKAAGLTLDIKSTFMLLLLAAVWGGSFFFGEVALSEVPPLTITLHRVVWAVPILALIVVLNGIAIPKSPSVWGAYLVMGALKIGRASCRERV